MHAQVNWRRRLSFYGSADSGFVVPLGGSLSAGGDEDGFRPMELIAIGLAGCTAMDVISILQKKRQVVTDFQVEAYAEQANDHPRVFTHITLEYHVTGRDVEGDAVVRAIQLSATKYCPAQGMLARVVPIELKYYIYEDGDGGERKLVESGIYQAQGAG